MLRLFALFLLFCSLPLAAAPRVTVSILPIHSLTASIMQGVGEPDLLLKGGQSPHSFSLRPSDARKLHRADVLIWIGPSLEASLSKAFYQHKDNKLVVTLVGDNNGEAQNHHHDHDHHHDHHDGMDPHIWLSPTETKQIAKTIRDALMKADPEHSERYYHNTKLLLARLAVLEVNLAEQLSTVIDVPYLVFHDAYGHFAKSFGTRPLGHVTLTPEQKPGARRIHQLRQQIHSQNVRCLFSEPQFESRIVNTLVAGTEVKTGVLDPLGTTLTPGPDAYFELMENLGTNLVSCLQD